MLNKDIETFRKLGWKIFVFESNKRSRTKNFVDIILIKPKKCVVFMECKRGNDKLTEGKKKPRT